MSGYYLVHHQEERRQAGRYVRQARPCCACGSPEVWAEYVGYSEPPLRISRPYCAEHAPAVRVLCARAREELGLRPADTPLSRWRRLYRGHSSGSRRYVSGLLRLLSAVGHLPRWDHTDIVMRGIQNLDESRAFRSAISLAERLFCEAYLPTPDPPQHQDQEPDTRPGCYYVSCMLRGDPERGVLVAGPYPTHAEALSWVDRVRDHATRLDRAGEAFWATWGTARTQDPSPTILGPWRGAQAQPEEPDDHPLQPTRR